MTMYREEMGRTVDRLEKEKDLKGGNRQLRTFNGNLTIYRPNNQSVDQFVPTIEEG